MITNENFTADMLRDLRSEQIRLNQIEELSSQLDSETKNIINRLCAALFTQANNINYSSVVYLREYNETELHQWENIKEWFKIQGFSVCDYGDNLTIDF